MNIAFPFWAVYQLLDNRLILAESMGFSEISRLGQKRERLRRHLQRNVEWFVERDSMPALYRRHIAAEPVVCEMEILLESTRKSNIWRGSLPLVFPYLRWRHDEKTELAFVPSLHLEVVAAPDNLAVELAKEIRLALSRNQMVQGLRKLVECQRASRIVVESHHVPVQIKSAKQRAMATELERSQVPSVLTHVATDLTTGPDEPVWGMAALIEQLAELLTSRRPRSVLLVGPSGVGKTAAVRELVRRRFDFQLGATPFWATSGARIVAGMSGFGMWQDRCQKLVQEVSRRRAILHLGNLIELLEVGRSEHNSTGIASFLRSNLARGELLAIAECTPEQLPVIERQDPHLLDVFHQLTVPEPDAMLGRTILEQYAISAPEDIRKPLSSEVIGTLDRLHRRYATYSAYPGRPLRFLRNLLQDCKPAAVSPGDVLTAFGRETGLPRVLLDPAERLDLDATRRWFADRVIDQDEAVELIADLLATTKAALARPRKPIASLLFIGPTGVGKTEMAKSLAEFLFGSRHRLTRFDMSEFADPIAVQRLAGGVFGSEGLLTARVREQPFSVLLFDEFEKAHPEFLDLMLQVLGEGRLTDAGGRLADFCNTVVILTSNLGAASYQQGALGFGGSGTTGDATAMREAAREHFIREVQVSVRPEFFNRIDRLVPFAPLGAETVRKIAERHLQRLMFRDGIRYRGVTVGFGDGVAARLARNGLDARYGARPLLRTVERELLAPLADQMNGYSADLALAVKVQLPSEEKKTDDPLSIAVKGRTDERGQAITVGTGSAPLVSATQSCVDLRRQVQALQRSAVVREFHNDLAQIERQQQEFERRQRYWKALAAWLAKAPPEVREKRLGKMPPVTEADRQRQTELARLRQVNARVSEMERRCRELEETALLSLYDDAIAVAPSDLKEAMSPLERDWDELLLTFYVRRFASPNAITLGFFSPDRESLFELVNAYATLAARYELEVSEAVYCLPPGAQTGKEVDDKERKRIWRPGEEFDKLIVRATAKEPEWCPIIRRWPKSPRDYQAEPPERFLGVALHLRGPSAAARFAFEGGVHVFRIAGKPQPDRCLVDVSELKLADYVPPEGIARRGPPLDQDRRRTYDRKANQVEDAMFPEPRHWPSRGLEDIIAELIEKRLQRDLLTVLEE